MSHKSLRVLQFKFLVVVATTVFGPAWGCSADEGSADNEVARGSVAGANPGAGGDSPLGVAGDPMGSTGGLSVSSGGSAMVQGSPTVDAGAVPDASGDRLQPAGLVVPAGCPQPDPQPVAGQDWAIAAVNARDNEVIFMNVSDTPQTLTEDYTWCVAPTYAPVLPPDGPSSVEYQPGEFIRVALDRAPLGAFEILVEGSEVGLYETSSVLDAPQSLRAFVTWGEGNPGGRTREGLAAQTITDGHPRAALWSVGERVDIFNGHVGFVATGRTDEASGYSSVTDYCMP